jgi:hypothetical protein
MISKRLPCGRAARVAGLGCALAGSALLLPWLVLRAIAGPNIVPPVIIESKIENSFDCIRDFLKAPKVKEHLEGILSEQSIWHIGSKAAPGGFEVLVYSAGRRRHTERFQVSVMEVALGSELTISDPAFRFSSSELKGPPMARTKRDLDVLRAAFDDQELREVLLEGFQSRHLDIATINLLEDQSTGELKLQFSSPVGEQTTPYVQVWQVKEDPFSDGYLFTYD